MAELADALDSKSCIFGCAGSTPALGTIFSLTNRGAFLCSLTDESYVAGLTLVVRFALVMSSLRSSERPRIK